MMMNKISYLSTFIQKKYSLSQKEADNFVSQMFEVISEALHTEKQVKIKGLGTFKVMSVSPRESVNVNTGERFVIEGRDKISFTPETSMRDRVNTPFSQFETVVLNDNVDFSEIDEKYNMLHVDDMEESNADVVLSDVTELSQEEKDSHIDDGTFNHQENVEDVQKEVIAPLDTIQLNMLNENVETEDKGLQPSDFVDKEEERTETENALSEANISIGNAQTNVENNSDDTTTEISSTGGNDNLFIRLQRSNRLVKILGTVIIVLLLLGCIGTYYVGRMLSLRDNRIEHLEATISQRPLIGHKKAAIIPLKKTVVEAKLMKDSVIQKDKQIKFLQHTNTASQQNSQASQNNADRADRQMQIQKAVNTLPDYDKDPRVKTGAYRIIGIEREIKVRKGQTLYSISNANLGPGMECYVEAVNGKKEFKEGETLKIPALKLKKKKK